MLGMHGWRRLLGSGRPSADDLYRKGYLDARRELLSAGPSAVAGLRPDPAMDFTAYDEGVNDAIAAHEAGWARLHERRPPEPEMVPVQAEGAPAAFARATTG